MERFLKKNVLLIVETLALVILTAWLAVKLSDGLSPYHFGLYAYLPLLIFQALVFQRLYIIGHEAAHRKLVPNSIWLNDLVGQLMLLPILIPIKIYRKVHMFHHGFNRKDIHTSALDVFVSPWPLTLSTKIFFRALWYLGVFAGGYFLHSIASVIIFLCIPSKRAERISPAFKNWDSKDRLAAWLQLLACFGFHGLVAIYFGTIIWFYALAFPFLAFAWVWSLLVYIFHFETTIGSHTRYNVRSIKQNWFFSWLLMNFNQHATHHMYPNIPWFMLPEKRAPLPEVFEAKNKTMLPLRKAIFNQLRGPTLIYAKDENPNLSLFIHWED